MRSLRILPKPKLSLTGVYSSSRLPGGPTEIYFNQGRGCASWEEVTDGALMDEDSYLMDDDGALFTLD